MTEKPVLLTPVPWDQLELRIAEVLRKELDRREPKGVDPPVEELLTRKAAAELLGVCLPTLHEYTQRGIFPAYRLGSRVRYKRAELLSALQGVRVGRLHRK